MCVINAKKYHYTRPSRTICMKNVSPYTKYLLNLLLFYFKLRHEPKNQNPILNHACRLSCVIQNEWRAKRVYQLKTIEICLKWHNSGSRHYRLELLNLEYRLHSVSTVMTKGCVSLIRPTFLM